MTIRSFPSSAAHPGMNHIILIMIKYLGFPFHLMLSQCGILLLRVNFLNLTRNSIEMGVADTRFTRFRGLSFFSHIESVFRRIPVLDYADNNR